MTDATSVSQAGARRVGLQFPEGLLMYACVISDILEAFAGAEHCYILGDVAYGEPGSCSVSCFPAGLGCTPCAGRWQWLEGAKGAIPVRVQVRAAWTTSQPGRSAATSWSTTATRASSPWT